MKKLETRGALIGIAAALGLMFTGPAAADPGSAKETATTVCAACHNADGNSSIPMFPKLAGLQEEYLTKQLKEFINGNRKSDVMAPVVANLKPEDIPALANYFARQKPQAGKTQDAALAEQGKKIFLDGNEETGVPGCVGCHQAGAAGNERYPRIAGQHPEYVVQQLKSFAAGDRSNDYSRFMRVTAKRMTEAEMKAVAEYLAGLETK